MRFVRESSLTLAFLGLFVASLVGQALVGHADFNHDQVAHKAETMSLERFLVSSAFWVDVMENWQSEYLQFTLFILGTVWLVQRGSTDSKPPGKEGVETDEQQKLGAHTTEESPKWARAGGLRTKVYSNSLVLLMAAIWVGSWAGQLVTGRVEYNARQLDHQEASLTVGQYATTSDFWNRTLQNWQSEFLALVSTVVFSIWLRQRGSAQSKPVGEAHAATGGEG